MLSRAIIILSNYWNTPSLGKTCKQVLSLASSCYNTSMEEMKEMREFVQKCQTILKENSDPATACGLIGELDLPMSAHPMLEQILSCADDVVYGYSYYDDEIEESLSDMGVLIGDFLANKFWPTRRCLSCQYGAFDEEGGQIKGLGIAISYVAGKTLIEAAGDKELYSVLVGIESKIVKDQADEWYLYSFAEMLPKEWNEFKLLDYSVSEVMMPTLL